MRRRDLISGLFRRFCLCIFLNSTRMPRIVRFADCGAQVKGRMMQSFQDDTFPLLISNFSKSLSFLGQNTVPVFEPHQIWSQKCVCWGLWKREWSGFRRGHCWCMRKAMSVLQNNLGVFTECGFTGLVPAGLFWSRNLHFINTFDKFDAGGTYSTLSLLFPLCWRSSYGS